MPEGRRRQKNTNRLRQGCCVTSVVADSVTPGTAAHQAPLFMGFSRQEYRSGLPFPSPGGPPDPGIEPESLMSPAVAEGFFTTSATASPAVRLTGFYTGFSTGGSRRVGGRGRQPRGLGGTAGTPQWARRGHPALERTHVTSVYCAKNANPNPLGEET